MIKKYITTVNIVFFIWGLLLIAISELFYEYTRYYLYLSILVIIPIIISDLIRKRKEDKRDGTALFKLSMYNILISAFILGILLLIIWRS